jgi:glycerol-3-phosphate dehydrogenase (NAD(P)+)
MKQWPMLIILYFAIPSANDELEKLTVSLENKVIFSAIKGIVPETSMIVGEHFHLNILTIGVITGPCHAEEVLRRLSYLIHRFAVMPKKESVAEHQAIISKRK